jgi:thymidine phosphorylase
VLVNINNRKISRLAKLAGAPDDAAAGVFLHAHLGDVIVAGAPLATIHAEAPGQLDYALDYARANADMFEIEA